MRGVSVIVSPLPPSSLSWPKGTLELPFPEGLARESASRIGPVRAGGGRTSGLRDCHFAAGRRATAVLGAGVRPVGPFFQEVLETGGEGRRKTWAQGPLRTCRACAPTATPPQPWFLQCRVGSPLGPSGGSRTHVLSVLRGAAEAVPWASVPLTDSESEARIRGARLSRRKRRFRWRRRRR